MTIELISTFFNAVQTRQHFVRDFETLYARKLAIRFNALDFVYWNETKVSEILAYFLDPGAGHGQGDQYLQLFLESFGLRFSYSNHSQIKVRLEESTDNYRRVDIVLSYNQGCEVLGIENKLYLRTADQKNQVRDYLAHLKSICSTDSYQLIYLAPKAKKLTEYSAGEGLDQLKKEGRLVMLNYEEDIIGLMGHFIAHTENERVRCFLEDFKRKLIEKYMGNENMDGGVVLAKYITETNDNLKMAFAVANTLNGVKAGLEEELTKQLAEVARELEIGFDSHHLHFVLPNLKNCYVKCSYEDLGVLYGLVKKPEFYAAQSQRIHVPELAAFLGVKFRSSQWWPLYYKQYADIDRSEEFWIDISNGKFSAFMKEFIVKVMALTPEQVNGL